MPPFAYRSTSSAASSRRRPGSVRPSVPQVRTYFQLPDPSAVRARAAAARAAPGVATHNDRVSAQARTHAAFLRTPAVSRSATSDSARQAALRRSDALLHASRGINLYGVEDVMVQEAIPVATQADADAQRLRMDAFRARRKAAGAGLSEEAKLVNELAAKAKRHLYSISADKYCVQCTEVLGPSPTVLRCGHRFHATCINNWYRIKWASTGRCWCPICRADMSYYHDTFQAVESARIAADVAAAEAAERQRIYFASRQDPDDFDDFGDFRN